MIIRLCAENWGSHHAKLILTLRKARELMRQDWDMERYEMGIRIAVASFYPADGSS